MIKSILFVGWIFPCRKWRNYSFRKQAFKPDHNIRIVINIRNQTSKMKHQKSLQWNEKKIFINQNTSESEIFSCTCAFHLWKKLPCCKTFDNIWFFTNMYIILLQKVSWKRGRSIIWIKSKQAYRKCNDKIKIVTCLKHATCDVGQTRIKSLPTYLTMK